MTARGVMGALVAVGAGLPFYPFWGALAVGAGAGLLLPLAQYAVDHWLRLEDTTSVVAVHGLSALWGLLAVGLLASGQVGAGWNRVGESAYLGVEGQGVSGYLVASGLASDWPGQFQAQAFGVAAIASVALLGSGILVGLARGVVRAWYGESRSRWVVRPSRRPRSRSRVRLPRLPALWARLWPRPEPAADPEPVDSEGDDLVEVASLGEVEERPGLSEVELGEASVQTAMAEPSEEVDR
jgi:hypothetical protein